MRTDLLPDMASEPLQSRSGESVSILIKVLQLDGKYHVFMREKHRFSDSSIASNALLFVEQILKNYQLDGENCKFYRYVFTPATGALFGCFNINWSGALAENYSFKMLNQQEAIQKLSFLLKHGSVTQRQAGMELVSA
jgi:hypothetical protein